MKEETSELKVGISGLRTWRIQQPSPFGNYEGKCMSRPVLIRYIFKLPGVTKTLRGKKKLVGALIICLSPTPRPPPQKKIIVGN